MKPRRIAINLLRVGLGLVVGLAITEVAFRARDDGAFPHLNVYVADAALGVRLRPGSTEAIRFGSKNNALSHVRINADGYRGADWGPPSASEIVVVGDSQAFGLGVEENETFASVLGSTLGVPVRNLGVPTYGPDEYEAVLEESLAKRPAKTVVWVVNMVNDLFEATRPNKTRHVVWDGWAVRAESGPAKVTWFPGREWLYGQSHAFYALRRWLYDRGDQNPEAGFASEGTWTDIGKAGVSAKHDHEGAEKEAEDKRQALHTEAEDVKRKVFSAEYTVETQVAKNAPELAGPEQPENEDAPLTNHELFRAATMNPGDIVGYRGGEGSRATVATAEEIRRGAILRNKLETRAKEAAAKANDTSTLQAFEQRDALTKKLDELEETHVEVAVRSPLSPAIERAAAACRKAKARLVVVVLPIDVQVSAGEWQKYGVDKPVDMKDSVILNADVVTAAERAGAEGIDVLPALESAEPGAFLDGDIHLTPKGHRTVAEAIAKVLRAPKVSRPTGGLPPKRSFAPIPDQWTPESEFEVTESDPAGCETKRFREWLGIFCNKKGGAKGVKVERGIDTFAATVPGAAMLVAPLVPGHDIHAVFAWEGSTRDLDARMENGVPIVAFSKPKPTRTDIPGPSPGATAYCKCEPACATRHVVPDDECARTYPNDCQKLLACSAGDSRSPPTCGENQVVTGGSHRCHALCSDDLPCPAGTTCTAWQGGQVCM